jgi:MFS family permease
MWLLIAARAAQGLGAAVMMALSVALVSEIVGKARTGRAMGLLGTTSPIGTALGPSLGGFLIAGFDYAGTLLLALTLTAYALAMTVGRGRFDPLNIALLMVAAFGAGLFALAERRAASPLLRLAMFREPDAECKSLHE